MSKSLDRQLEEMEKMRRKMQRYQADMCLNPVVNITYCSDYKTGRCRKSCNYAKREEAK